MLGAAGRIDRENQTQEIIQSMPDARIGQLVSGPTTLGHRDHEPATTQTPQMIGHRLTRDPDRLGQIGGMLRRLTQSQQDLRASGIGEGIAEPGQRIGMNHGLHADDDTSNAVLKVSCIAL